MDVCHCFVCIKFQLEFFFVEQLITLYVLVVYTMFVVLFGFDNSNENFKHSKLQIDKLAAPNQSEALKVSNRPVLLVLIILFGIENPVHRWNRANCSKLPLFGISNMPFNAQSSEQRRIISLNRILKFCRAYLFSARKHYFIDQTSESKINRFHIYF